MAQFSSGRKKKVGLPDSEIQQTGGMQIDEHMDYQNGEWTAQRIGWILMAAFLIATGLGLFGGRGPLNAITVQSDDGRLIVMYDRFDRFKAGGSIEIDVIATPQDTAVRIEVDRKLAEHMQIESAVPSVASTTAGDDRVVYAFDKTVGATTMKIVLNTKWAASGRIEGRLGLVGGAGVHISRFIYP